MCLFYWCYFYRLHLSTLAKLLLFFLSLSLFFLILVPPDIQIEPVGKTPAPSKMKILASSQKTDLEAETWVSSHWVKMRTTSLENLSCMRGQTCVIRDAWCVICVCACVFMVHMNNIFFPHSIFTLYCSHSIITDEHSFFCNAALLWFEMRMHWSFTNIDQTNKKSTLLILTRLHPFNHGKIQC